MPEAGDSTGNLGVSVKAKEYLWFRVVAFPPRPNVDLPGEEGGI